MSSHKLFKKSFNAGKCKTSMKLAMSRMKLLRNKRQEQLKVMKRNLAQILQSGQEQTARARVEHVYREENTIAAYDLLESFCEQIIARLQIIESQKKCPLDLEEPISSILFASQRCAEIQELTDVRHHFSSKYGKEFVSAAVELRAGCRVNRSVIEKLSAKTPDGQTKLKMLAAIAKEHNVDWDPDVVEEQVSGLPETKLAGPTEFITATKFTEFPDVPKHNPGTKFVDHDTNIRPPEHPTSQINSEKPRAPGPGTSNANAAPDYQPRAPANVAADESVDIKYKHEDLLLEKSHWHRHFKDATTAAKAAAESAEKASIAARAAAELSSLEKMSRQNSIESRESERGNIPVELPHSQLNKTLHEGLTNKNECPPKSFHATDGTFQGEVKDNGEEKPGTGYDHRNLKATRSKSGSSRSKFSSHDNELFSSGAQWTENPCPSSSQQKETVNIKRQSYENVSDDLSEDGSVKKRLNPSHFRDSTYCDFKTETVTESFGGPEVASMQRTGVHSPRSPPENETLIMKRLPSQGDKFGSHGEGNVSKSTFTGSKTEVDAVIVSTENHHLPLSSTSGEGIFSRGDTAKPASTHDSGAIFDDSGSESESCLDLEDAVIESKLHGLVPVARSSNSVPSTLHPRMSREPGNESLKKDGYTVPSRSTSDMQYTSSSSERNVKATEPSPYHGPVLPAFDDSDSFEASSEEEANGGSPILRNVSSSRGSPPSPHINHGPVEFASYSGNKVREQKKKQPPVLHDSDSDDSFDGNTVSVSGYSPGGNSPVRSSISTVKDQKRMNSLEPYSTRVTTATFYTDTGGPEPSVDSDTDSSNVLKFDRLGGLRNKGRIRPPYRSDPSHISSSNVNNLTSEESSLSYTPQASHTGKISLSLRENEESSKSKGSFELQKKKSKSSGHYFVDTDSDSDDPVDPGVSIVQGVGRGTRTTLSSDFQEQHRFNGSKTEILASVESGVSGKRRSPEKTPILPDEELTKLVYQGARGSGRTNVVPVASVRTAGRSARSSQPTTHRNPMVVDELDTTSSLNSSFSESRHDRPVRGTHVEEEPRPITKTQKMETKTPRRSYDYIDLDSDEPIDTGSLLQQNLVSRRGKASPSYMKPARENPPQATQVGRPEIIKVDNSASNHSHPVSHVEDQPKHTSKTVASRSLKDIKGSEVANKGLKPSEPRRTLLENKEMKTSRTSYHDYIDSDSDEPIDTGSLLQQNLVSRRGKASPSYMKPARESPPQATQVGRPEIIKVDSAPIHSLPVSYVEDQPKHTSKTVASRSPKDVKDSEVANKGLRPYEPRRTLENKEMKTSRTSYHDYIDSDSDEPIDTGSLLQQNLVRRHGKASPSYMKPARESPPQATQVGRPEIIKVDTAPNHSLPVSHVEDQPKHTSKTVASRSPKDVKDSEVANKGLRPSEPRRTLENKEMKTSRTSYHGFSSDSDESTKTREHVGTKKVHKNSKDDSLQRTALQDNPPYQPSGAGSKFRAKVEVPDSKVSSTSQQNQPPETHRESQKQTKPAASDTSRADVKPSGSSVPTTSRENSFQRASHVHPKLPEYDSLLKMFQDARREK